ncbi:MAG: outer membrane beta-barrel protein [Chitinophagaceae bacterium]|nr:outer membrane beta-barrel protein [Chitinophagaceae bacterium]
MKTIISIAFCLISVQPFAQRLHVNAFAGASNYSGDLQPKRFSLSHPGFARGLGISYDISDKISIRAEYSYAKITGDDKLSSRNQVRNLNFTSYISEWQIAGEYYLKDMQEYSTSPYLFAGVAVYHFNPFTNDTSGNKAYLKFLNTEGQGFYQNRKPYNLTQFAIPFGAGYKWVLTNNISLGIELGMRKLFTDYLDDVSTTYVDQNLLLSNSGPKAVELSFRSNELNKGLQPYPADGTQRGDPKDKDWYYFTVLKASVALGNSDNRKHSSKLGCPTRF